jgi:hypothetical protein
VTQRHVCLTTVRSGHDPAQAEHYLQVDGHPRIRIDLVECTDLGLAAQEEFTVEWTAVAGSEHDECLRFPLTPDFRRMIPERAFA